MSLPAFFQVLESIATTIALIIGGIWAYFNFFKGRAYHHRLEPKIMCKTFKRDGAYYLLTISQLTNVGLSRVDIEQKGSGLRILNYKPEAARRMLGEDAGWQHLVTYPVFTKHKWIESKETIEDPFLIELRDSSAVASKLELRIVSTKKLNWATSTIVEVQSVEKGVNSESSHASSG